VSACSFSATFGTYKRTRNPSPVRRCLYPHGLISMRDKRLFSVTANPEHAFNYVFCRQCEWARVIEPRCSTVTGDYIDRQWVHSPPRQLTPITVQQILLGLRTNVPLLLWHRLKPCSKVDASAANWTKLGTNAFNGSNNQCTNAYDILVGKPE
jgi:hypothetical protein